MKRKFLTIFLVLILAMSMVACGGTESTPADNTSSETETESEVNSGSGTLGNYAVAINDARFGTDGDGNKVIVISYDFTNNSDESASAMWSLVTKAFQNGIELESAYYVEGTDYNLENEDKDIKPGATITDCQCAFILDDDSDVEFEIEELVSFSDDVVKKTFTVQQ